MNASILYRRSEAEMPARAEEVHHAKDEGVQFQMLTNPVEFIGDDRLRADIIEELMCQGAADLVTLGFRHGADLRCLDSVWGPLELFEDQGLLTMDDAVIRLTPKGRSLVRTVCTAFDRYFVHDTARHARAV